MFLWLYVVPVVLGDSFKGQFTLETPGIIVSIPKDANDINFVSPKVQRMLGVWNPNRYKESDNWNARRIG